MIYDVSMPLREGMPFYTGSTPFRRVLTHELSKGQPVNESRLEMGALCVEALTAVLLEGRIPANAVNPEVFR